MARPVVTRNSTDEELIAAVDAAGDVRPPYRHHDWPTPLDRQQKSWVKPGDIGISTGRDSWLLDRLKALAAIGHLGQHGVPPRFRVHEENRERIRAAIDALPETVRAEHDQHLALGRRSGICMKCRKVQLAHYGPNCGVKKCPFAFSAKAGPAQLHLGL